MNLRGSASEETVAQSKTFFEFKRELVGLLGGFKKEYRKKPVSSINLRRDIRGNGDDEKSENIRRKNVARRFKHNVEVLTGAIIMSERQMYSKAHSQS